MVCFLHLFGSKRIVNFLLVSTTRMRKLQLAYNQKSIKNQIIKKWNFRYKKAFYYYKLASDQGNSSAQKTKMWPDDLSYVGF